MGYGLSFMGSLVSLALTAWLVIFSILVLQKLDRIAQLLEKNKQG